MASLRRSPNAQLTGRAMAPPPSARVIRLRWSTRPARRQGLGSARPGRVASGGVVVATDPYAVVGISAQAASRKSAKSKIAWSSPQSGTFPTRNSTSSAGSTMASSCPRTGRWHMRSSPRVSGPFWSSTAIGKHRSGSNHTVEASPRWTSY